MRGLLVLLLLVLLPVVLVTGVKQSQLLVYRFSPEFDKMGRVNRIINFLSLRGKSFLLKSNKLVSACYNLLFR